MAGTIDIIGKFSFIITLLVLQEKALSKYKFGKAMVITSILFMFIIVWFN